MKLTPGAALVALLLVYISLAALISLIIPLGEAADEVSHHSYVRYVAVYGGLPPVREGTTVYGETFQPPLYYALAAPLTRWLPPGDAGNLGFTMPVEANPDWALGDREQSRLLLQPESARWPWHGEALGWRLVRFLSIALGAITVLATFWLCRLVFPQEPWTPLLAAALVAFLPTFTGLSGTVNNDVLATTLSALLLLQLARLVHLHHQDPEPIAGWTIVGALGALGVWTKASGWVFVGSVVVAAMLLWRDRAGAAGISFLVKRLVAAGGTWLLLVLPLWWLNLRHSGDLMGQGIQRQVTEARQSLTLAEGWDLLAGLYRSWWAAFGGAMHLHFPDWLNLLLFVPVALAMLGLLKRHRRRGTSSPVARRLILLLAIHCLFVFGAWLLWSSMVMGTGQARLLFASLPAIAVLGAGGLTAILPRLGHGGRRAALGWSGAALALLLATLLLVLLPAYRGEPVAVAAPAAAPPTEAWQVGELPLQLVGVHFDLDNPLADAAGPSAPLYVEFLAAGPLPDVRMHLRWLDDTGNSVWVKQTTPLAGHPLTDEWSPGRYSAWHSVHLPEGVPPGQYRLMLNMRDHLSGEPYTFQNPRAVAGHEIMVGQVTREPDE
jgi:hypothetical protein